MTVAKSVADWLLMLLAVSAGALIGHAAAAGGI